MAAQSIQTVKVLVIVGQIAVPYRVAEVAIQRDVLDACALQPQNLRRIDNPRRLRPEIARNHIAGRIDDRQPARSVRGREDGVGELQLVYALPMLPVLQAALV